MRLCLSDAHEVMEALPINSGVYVCVRCGAHGSHHDMFTNPETRCSPHLETEGSGWAPMTGTDYFEVEA